jgi:hypothetical protein
MQPKNSKRIEKEEMSDISFSLAQFDSADDLKRQIRSLLSSQQKKGCCLFRLTDDGHYLHVKFSKD